MDPTSRRLFMFSGPTSGTFTNLVFYTPGNAPNSGLSGLIITVNGTFAQNYFTSMTTTNGVTTNTYFSPAASLTVGSNTTTWTWAGTIGNTIHKPAWWDGTGSSVATFNYSAGGSIAITVTEGFFKDLSGGGAGVDYYGYSSSLNGGIGAVSPAGF